MFTRNESSKYTSGGWARPYTQKQDSCWKIVQKKTFFFIYFTLKLFRVSCTRIVSMCMYGKCVTHNNKTPIHFKYIYVCIRICYCAWMDRKILLALFHLLFFYSHRIFYFIIWRKTRSRVVFKLHLLLSVTPIVSTHTVSTTKTLKATHSLHHPSYTSRKTYTLTERKMYRSKSYSWKMGEKWKSL